MKPPRILIIDDEKAVRDSFSAHLEDCGYQIITAGNGRLGLDRFERESPDLVLVDLRMPEVDGLQVLEAISRRSPLTPLLVASGTGIINDAIEALHRGAWDYLLKPIADLSILTHAVSAALEKAQLKKENQAYRKHLERLVEERTAALACEALRAVRASEELRENASRFRRILDTIPTGILIVDATTHEIVYANPSAAGLIGVDPLSIIGKTCNAVFATMRAGTCPMALGKETVQAERILLTVDGREVPVLKTVSRTTLEGRECFMESFIDLTEQVRAEVDKEKLETQLRQAQKMEALGTLAGGIAHDFNNILSAVLGYSELGLQDLDPQHALYTKLQAINHAGSRARALVEQILSFSRMQEQLQAPLKVSPILKEVLKLLQSSLPANIRITSAIKADRPVLGDPTQIHQIIMNLCTNAYHAMQMQGGELRITLEEVTIAAANAPSTVNLPPGPYLRLTVADTGAGIQPAIMDRIFDPYFTTKDKSKGTGLGLAVVHGIVNRHGGSITVESKVSAGSCFTVLLPICADTSAESGKPSISLPRGTEHILLVDDEKEIVDIGDEMLRRLGYRVTAVIGSLPALEMFKADPLRFDLVITDYNMPGMAGDQMARRMLSIRKELPIIVCTGFSELFDSQQAQSLGIRRTLMKPVTMEAMANTVREVLASP